MPIIDIVEDEFVCYFTDIKNCLDEMGREGDLDAHRVLSSDLQMLKSAKAIITMGNIAKLLLKCTDTFQAKKNWNSHGASVGSAICQFASILSQLTTAHVNELKDNFNSSRNSWCYCAACGLYHDRKLQLSWRNIPQICTEFVDSLLVRSHYFLL